MKKLFTFLGLLAIFLPLSAQALYVQGGVNRYDLNDGVQLFSDLTILMDTTDLPITAEHGIGLIIADVQYALWDRETITASTTGSATDKERIAAAPALTYSQDLKTVRIPVLKNWEVGDQVMLSGLKVRIYDRISGNQAVGIDLDGDNQSDYASPVTIRIDDNARTDQTPPYPVDNLAAQVFQDPLRVELSWKAPLDYDLQSFDVERKVNGGDVEFLVLSGALKTHTDTDVSEGQSIEYLVYSKDRRNRQVTSITVDIKTDAPEASETPPQATPSPTTPETPAEPVETETDRLSRLFNYYRIRHSIKCGRNPGDSACLWSKINLVYAQQKLSRSDVDVALSGQDLKIMGKRIKYSQKRYDTYCVDVLTPRPYCANLKRALNQANYFLNQ